MWKGQSGRTICNTSTHVGTTQVNSYTERLDTPTMDCSLSAVWNICFSGRHRSRTENDWEMASLLQAVVIQSDLPIELITWMLSFSSSETIKGASLWTQFRHESRLESSHAHDPNTHQPASFEVASPKPKTCQGICRRHSFVSEYFQSGPSVWINQWWRGYPGDSRFRTSSS